MSALLSQSHEPKSTFAVHPLCPVFGKCGGCHYQDISYDQELRIKETQLYDRLKQNLDIPDDTFDPIVPSPEPYHYRNRLDLSLLKIKSGETFLGFRAERRFQVIPVDMCAIARKEISDFLPKLKEEATKKLPQDYRLASIVVKTGDDQRLVWGGIGRRSLRLEESDYLFTEICGRKIYYSLDTFFQTNTFILPILKERIDQMIHWNGETLFFDLYSGVGLFGILFAEKARKIIMVEENEASVKLAQFNVKYHNLKNVEILSTRLEDQLPLFFKRSGSARQVYLIDPPRQGLSQNMVQVLVQTRPWRLFYLSCNPEALSRDLICFTK